MFLIDFPEFRFLFAKSTRGEATIKHASYPDHFITPSTLDLGPTSNHLPVHIFKCGSVSVSERDIYVHGGVNSLENESYNMISIGLPNWNAYFQKKLLSSSEKVGKSSKNAFEVAIPLYIIRQFFDF